MPNLKTCTLLSVLLYSFLMPLQAASADAIQPFTATYTAQWFPLTIKGKAIRSLKKDSSGRSHLFFQGSMLTYSLQENAVLNWQDCTPVPQSFNRRKKQFLNYQLVSDIRYDWKNKHVTAQYKGSTLSLPLDNNTFDSLTYQLALRCDLKQNRKKFEYTVAEKSKLKHYRFHKIGEEIINTALGLLKTVKLRRSSDSSEKQTTLWFAKELDYTLVKLEQIRSDNNHFVITINELKND